MTVERAARLAIPVVWSSRSKPRPSIVFDTYWRFAAERQAIFFRRLAGDPPPWTDDPILQTYKFTNAYRASDRTSQYLIRNVIYEGSADWGEVFFRTILFKLFNRIETWEAIAGEADPPRSDRFDQVQYREILTETMRRGSPIYSAAYIMPPVSLGKGSPKHWGHLALLASMLQLRTPQRVAEAKSLREVYELLRSFPSIGRFLAYQLAIDLDYAPDLPFTEGSFVIAGPGANEGIAKCFEARDGWSDEDLILWTTERQQLEFDRLGIHFQDLWGRALQPIDCQNLFCEVAKYARVALPLFNARGGRTRIKQRFAAQATAAPPWYPPKWSINQRLSSRVEIPTTHRAAELDHEVPVGASRR
jgi:hypothetical protein